jgi:hypothetical protein
MRGCPCLHIRVINTYIKAHTQTEIERLSRAQIDENGAQSEHELQFLNDHYEVLRM